MHSYIFHKCFNYSFLSILPLTCLCVNYIKHLYMILYLALNIAFFYFTSTFSIALKLCILVLVSLYNYNITCSIALDVLTNPFSSSFSLNHSSILSLFLYYGQPILQRGRLIDHLLEGAIDGQDTSLASSEGLSSSPKFQNIRVLPSSRGSIPVITKVSLIPSDVMVTSDPNEVIRFNAMRKGLMLLPLIESVIP